VGPRMQTIGWGRRTYVDLPLGAADFHCRVDEVS
jgi:hypothetical protein